MGLFLEAGSGGLYRIARLLFEETKKIKRVHGTGNTAKAVVGRWIDWKKWTHLAGTWCGCSTPVALTTCFCHKVLLPSPPTSAARPTRNLNCWTAMNYSTEDRRLCTINVDNWRRQRRSRRVRWPSSGLHVLQWTAVQYQQSCFARWWS